MLTIFDYGIRRVKQARPMPSLCYDWVKQSYQMVRNAMQTIKIAACAEKGLCDYFRMIGKGRL